MKKGSSGVEAKMIEKLFDSFTAGGGSVVSFVTSQDPRLIGGLISEGIWIALPGVISPFQSQIDWKLWGEKCECLG